MEVGIGLIAGLGEMEWDGVGGAVRGAIRIQRVHRARFVSTLAMLKVTGSVVFNFQFLLSLPTRNVLQTVP